MASRRCKQCGTRRRQLAKKASTEPVELDTLTMNFTSPPRAGKPLTGHDDLDLIIVHVTGPRCADLPTLAALLDETFDETVAIAVDLAQLASRCPDTDEQSALDAFAAAMKDIFNRERASDWPRIVVLVGEPAGYDAAAMPFIQRGFYLDVPLRLQRMVAADQQAGAANDAATAVPQAEVFAIAKRQRKWYAERSYTMCVSQEVIEHLLRMQIVMAEGRARSQTH